MLKFISGNKSYYIISLLFIAIGSFLIVFLEKNELHLHFNDMHTGFGDFFFRWWTHVGDGITLGVFAVALLLFFSFDSALRAGVTFLGVSLIAQTLKRQVFPEYKRPSHFFSATDFPLEYVEGVNVHCCNSFPSGHTMAGFALFTCIALISKKKNMGALYFMGALMIGLSRIYIQQHFFEDVLAGTVLGIVWTTLVFGLFEKTGIQKKTKWQKSLVATIFSK